MSKGQRRVIDDDGDGDPNILQDGESMRVPMRFADAQQRQVAAFAQNGGGFNRPGFRTTRDAAATQRVADAYQSYERDLVSSWKDADPVPPTGAGEHAMLGAHVGDVCTVRNAEYPLDFGSPGHLKMIGSRLVCVPDQPRAAAPPAAGESTADARRAVADAYAVYEKSQCEAWKTP